MMPTVLLALALAMVLPSRYGRAEDPGGVCGLLLTDWECSSYLAQLAQASTEKERLALKKAHASLVKERARLCPSREHDSTGVSGNVAPRRKQHVPSRIWM